MQMTGAKLSEIDEKDIIGNRTMPRGGARPNTGGARLGAGRPKGSKNKKTRALLEIARGSGITPLEVMIYNMRRHFEAERYDEATDIAAMAAPYVHPKLAATAVSSTVKDRGPPDIRTVEYILVDPQNGTRERLGDSPSLLPAWEERKSDADK
jgi:hypothetical protein